MPVLLLHQQRDRLGEQGDPLLGKLVRDELVENAVVPLSLDASGAVRRSVEVGVMEPAQLGVRGRVRLKAGMAHMTISLSSVM